MYQEVISLQSPQSALIFWESVKVFLLPKGKEQKSEWLKNSERDECIIYNRVWFS